MNEAGFLTRLKESVERLFGPPTEPPKVEVRPVEQAGALYPRNWQEFIGQKDLVRLLQMEVGSAKATNRPLAHLLFYGPPGTGKTAAAHVLAAEMGAELYESTGPEFPDQVSAFGALDDIVELHERTRKTVLWLIDEIDGMARSATYALHGILCPVVGTRILTADLQWVRVEELQVGDELVGIDEEPQGTKRRKLRKSVVTSTGYGEDICVRVVTDRGDICVNEQHPLLTARRTHGSKKHYRRQRWMQVRDLKVGDQVWFVGDPWETDRTYDAGWLSGLSESEGHFSMPTNRRRGRGAPTGSLCLVVASQAEGQKARILERAQSMLESRDFTPSRRHEDRSHIKNHQNCGSISLGRLTEILRYLGMIRPTRFLQRWSDILSIGAPGLPRKDGFATILRIEPIGRQPIVNLATSTHTYIAEGFISHNTHGHATWQGQRLYERLPVSIIGTSNFLSGVPGALKSRMEPLQVSYYPPEDLAIIARHSAARLGIDLTPEAADFIGANAAGEPRRVNIRLLRVVRNMQNATGAGVAGLEVAQKALQLAGLRPLGLTKPQFDALEFIEQMPHRTAGLSSVGAALQMGPKDVMSEVEGYLIYKRLLLITPRGRTLSLAGLAYLENARKEMATW